MRDHFQDIGCSVGNICVGAYGTDLRQQTTVTYAEFPDSDTRNAVLQAIQLREPKPICQYKSKNIVILNKAKVTP